MQQKKTANVSTSNALVRDIAETIKNPILLTMVGGNWTLIQSKIVESMLVQIQDQIEDKIAKRQHDFVLDNSYVAGGLVNIEIQIKSLGIPSQKYSELEQACDTLSKMQNIYEELDTNTGQYYKVWKNIFHKVMAETSSKTISGDDVKYKSGERKTGVIRIQMVEDSAREILSLRKGYTEHLIGIPTLCRSPRTPRFYAFLSAWRDKGEYTFSYLDLKEWCGATKLNQARTKINERYDTYVKFSEFKRCVLDPAQKELKKLAEQNKVDFYFEYTPIYKNGLKSGNPQSVHFLIIPSERGKVSFEERFLRDVHHRLIDAYRLTPDEWNTLEPLLNGIEHKAINTKIKELDETMRKLIPSVPHAFITKQLSGWAKLQEKITYASFEEISSEQAVSEQKVDARWTNILEKIKACDMEFYESFAFRCEFEDDGEHLIIKCPSSYVIEKWNENPKLVNIIVDEIGPEFYYRNMAL